jgi:hypothetical protein
MELYKKIQRDCFHMLDETVSNQFKVLNIPTLAGCSTSMLIGEMLEQLNGIVGSRTP